MFVWILAGVRQFPTKYRYFFLILALNDPLGKLLLFVIPPENLNYIHPITSFLLFYSTLFFDEDKSEKFLAYFLPIAIIGTYFITNQIEPFFVVIHIFIFIKLFKIATLHLFNKNKFSIFKYMFVFYELTIMINILLKYLENEQYYFLFFFTLGFQMLIGIFFTVVREDKMNLEYSLNLNLS